MKKNIFVGLFAVISFSFGGCATVFHGSSQAVTFNSEPEGANIVVEGNIMGKTPATINLRKSKYKNVVLRKDGFEPANVSLNTSYDPITLVDIFWDCSTTDLITGNAYEYEPNTYTVKLSKLEGEGQKK